MYHLRRSRVLRAFSLAELIVVVIVLAVLAAFATLGFRAVADRSQEGRQKIRTTSLLKEARTLYVQKIYQDPTYSWQQAVIDATADLPAYKTGAFSEGVGATGNSNLNTASNTWSLELDSGDAVYSTAPSELVFSVISGVLYIASATTDAPAVRAVFGMVSESIPPTVWIADCAGSTCDAGSASSGPPSSGTYGTGTTTATTAAPTTTAAASTTAAPTTTAAPATTAATTTTTAAPVLSAPSAPTMAGGSMSGSSVVVSFSAPSSSGSSPVTSYTATCTSSNGGATRTASGTSSPLTAASIDPLKTYSCSVTATNAVGTSPASSAITVSSTASYSCPSGGSLSGTTCTQTVATYSYSCPPGGSLVGGTCYAGYGSTTYGPGVGCNTQWGWYDYGGGCAFTAYSSVSYSYPTYAAAVTYNYTVT